MEICNNLICMENFKDPIVNFDNFIIYIKGLIIFVKTIDHNYVLFSVIYSLFVTFSPPFILYSIVLKFSSTSVINYICLI